MSFSESSTRKAPPVSQNTTHDLTASKHPMANISSFREHQIPPGAVAGKTNLDPLNDHGDRVYTDAELKDAFDTFDLAGKNYVGAAEIRHLLTVEETFYKVKT